MSISAVASTTDGANAPRPSSCPVCGHGAGEPFFTLADVPVHCNILLATTEAAKAAPRGTVSLAFCRECGLVYNTAFDPALVTYDAAYENSLHYSPRFEAYAAELARDLSTRLHLRDRLVVEVGCGKGEFLRRLVRTAGARGLGIDASYDPSIAAGADDPVTFVREPFSSLPADVKPALVMCRHVIEHLAAPVPFVRELAAAARRSPDGRVFIEVPNVLFTLRDLGIWDLIYEHCLYFSAPSLARLCTVAGLRVDRVSPAFGDQFLCAEATAREEPSRYDGDELPGLASLVDRFAAEYARKLREWRERLAAFQESRKRVAVWGAGSKGVTFVNAVPGGERIACLVDLNPRKHGRFVPGTGQPVVGPEALAQVRPDVIVVMNPLYRDEIVRTVEGLDLKAATELA